jgi:5-methylcytosine-specific restriction endonuclease McrA
MQRQCKNPKCGRNFEPKSIIHAFCSNECRKAIRGSEYRKAREFALIRDGYACTECGSEEHLECHHINPLCKGGDNSLKNLQTLCRQHHKAKHRSWKEDAIQNETRQGLIRSEEYDYAA